MTYTAAQKYLHRGEKITLPEWHGYWFLDENNELTVHTRTGDTIHTPYVDDYIHRTDWEITTGLRDFSGALIAIKHNKKLKRIDWPDGQYITIINPYSNKLYSVIEKTVNSILSSYLCIHFANSKIASWLPSQDDMLSEDWLLIE